ncbi:AMIN-like domain-containing (lipo)protein [Kitasatospora paranensis]|uniref:AMIN-like domain-containing protein n=1 Tax=Kitasatospora paranensis TaxID=258053 RepID=A0ABW2G3T7_9ACTN
MRRWTTALAAVILAAGAAATTIPTAAAASAATACPTGWGSLDRQDRKDPYQPQALTNIRTGAQECFDRLVLDVPGTTPANPLAYQVHYVTGNAVQQAGSGTPIPVRGGAVLEIVVGATTYDPATWQVVYPGRAGEPLPGVDLNGYRTFADTRFAGSFEGETQIGLGVRARLPFRVFQLDNRLVIDVAHTWGATA